MKVIYFAFCLTIIVNNVFSKEKQSFVGCESLIQFSLNNGSVVGILDYHFNRNPDTTEMFADIRGFTTTIPANFNFGIKHLNGDEWHCSNSTIQYKFMSCTHPLIYSDTFIVSLKTSRFLPNLLELNNITIDNNGLISWNGHSFTDNCIYHNFKYGFYNEPLNVQQKLCCW